MTGARTRFEVPTLKDIKKARRVFQANESRDLFYLAASELVDRAIRRKTRLSVAEAVAVLLQTWNNAYYRYKPFDKDHLRDIRGLIRRYKRPLAAARKRRIESFTEKDEAMVNRIFDNFEDVLGPVGAAKCLHFLAPRFFPLWDRAIAKAYRVGLKPRGGNSSNYCRFMEFTKQQCRKLNRNRGMKGNILKDLDEYNYVKYTKRLME